MDQFTPAGLDSPLTPQVAPQPQIQQPPLPVSPPVPPVPPRPQGPSPLFKRLSPILLVVGAIFFGAFVFYIIQKITTKQSSPAITTVVVTPTPTPTPIRHPTNVSTTSAFLSLQDEVSSLSAGLTDFSKDDPALNPPDIVLSLGF